ncbi:Hypothetical predicted protein [Cloeon dipterum]|uniref:Uncharacterized protein n=1 Tax=Cloeon dipterum TaxID=197152 RepID=A0A8S1DJG8_9INSE|nr:Hypothetical predicted protein [Cloeon dipterum]
MLRIQSTRQKLPSSLFALNINVRVNIGLSAIAALNYGISGFLDVNRQKSKKGQDGGDDSRPRPNLPQMEKKR